VGVTRGAEAASPLPSLQQKCGDSDVVAQPFLVPTSDGVQLYSIEAGTGPSAIVLVHESPADLCGWLPYIPSLTAAGFRVLAFDLRGFSNSALPPKVSARAHSRDLAAEIARTRTDGARRVFLLGPPTAGRCHSPTRRSWRSTV